MMVPQYLQVMKLSDSPVDYSWDNERFNEFWTAHDESSPRLAAAINSISSSAAFALGLACAEWVIARVEGHVDIADALQRVEAGWAAECDVRYARLPPPQPSAPDAPKHFASPLRLAMKLVAHAHELYSQGSLDLHSRAQGLAMLADHLVGRNPAFAPWLSESLRRCHEISPDTGVPVDQETRVPPELFASGFDGGPEAAAETLQQYVASLEPSGNPYLRSVAELREMGMTAPYGRSD